MTKENRSDNNLYENDHPNKNDDMVGIFKISDYDLDWDERKEKFKDYDHVLCEKCKEELNDHYYCDNCYEMASDHEKENCILNGRCKECNKSYPHINWCKECNAKRFQRDFPNWTSGNQYVDEFIRNSQITSEYCTETLEWIPYNRFTDIKYEGGNLTKTYLATW